MYLGRPIDRETMLCTISMALIDERPVRRSPRKAVDRFEVLVDGVRSHVIDVSPEGLRLEVPANRRLSLPPFFSVRVSIVGLPLMVQRMWGIRRSVTASWYGAALARNSTRRSGRGAISSKRSLAPAAACPILRSGRLAAQ